MTEYMQMLAHISLTAITAMILCYSIGAIIFCALAVRTMVKDSFD